MRIFVVGSPRSGTTLLQSLLACHPQVTSFTETHFFTKHYRRFDPYGFTVLTRDPVPRMEAFAQENGLPSGHFRLPVRVRVGLPLHSGLAARRFLQYLDWAASQRGADGWVEKTPGHLWFIDRIESAAEEPVRFVHMLRNGCDTVTSVLKASPQWGAQAPTIESRARRWTKDLKLTAARVRSGQDLLVTYEDLATEPISTMTSLCKALDISWRPEWLHRRDEVVAEIVTPSETWKSDTSGKIEPRSGFGAAWGPDQQAEIRRAVDDPTYTELLPYRIG